MKQFLRVLLTLTIFTCAAAVAAPPANPDVARVASLEGAAQQRALAALLADPRHYSEDSLFYYEAQLRQSLRALLRDQEVGERASGLLSFIGEPDDLRLIVQLAPPAGTDRLFANRWAYDVVCALLEPGSDEEWAFLRKAALNEYNDRWVDYGAIQTLKLIASPRSREILEEARQHNEQRAKMIAGALEYIDSHPPALVDENLEALAERVARAIGIGDWQGNRAPRFNQAGDKALVNITFIAGSDRLTYTATFHRLEGTWKFRGARETLQELMPPPQVVTPPAR